MKKVVGAFDTLIQLEGDEPQTICKLGQGEPCCAFLVMSSDGFECVRMVSSFSIRILDRLKEGTMNAKGGGEWEGCPWAPENKEKVDG